MEKSYSISLEFCVPYTRNLAHEKLKNMGPFFPFTHVNIILRETHKCPFCGEKLKKFSCNCQEFKNKFSRLQEKYGDSKHYSRLHYLPFEEFEVQRPIANIEIQPLGLQDVSNLGPDIWDESEKIEDKISGMMYRFSQLSCDNEKISFCDLNTKKKISFLWKNLNTKDVYLCKIRDIPSMEISISLGIYHKKFIPGYTKKIGDYKPSFVWDDLAKFSNWENLSHMLKSI